MVYFLAKRFKTSNGTVLVVENEELLRLSLQKMLRREGLHVIKVADGTAAVNLLRDFEKEIDLVLLGHDDSWYANQCRGYRGRQVATERKTTSHQRLSVGPVVNVKQVRGFIRKPFPLLDLITQIRDIICLTGLSDSLRTGLDQSRSSRLKNC
jgi:CheY-like chemotaxis protein